jgi:toxin ParE1/3/4
MTKSLRIDDEAETDLIGSASAYERQRQGLGLRFVVAVEDALDLIRRYPDIGTAVPGVPEAAGAKRVLVKGFPFSIVYVDLPQETRVVAIAHSRRKPAYWLGR